MKEFIKRDYDFDLNDFTLTYTIKIYDLYNIQDKDGFWSVKSETVDIFQITDKEIEEDYNGIPSRMWRELEEEYNITKKRY
ncbi:hypothetical protein SEQ01_17920 [Streptococcus equinus]|uniref:hypothetical protein n=1 Tax=Streptococcus equinus TaxID=1335 RepID=UPI00114306A4|nr:hypothetical protein [Streptococcus equinus]GEB11601.1 hypothetical protein SEQ01_17920 [Streptococcus equinus]